MEGAVLRKHCTVGVSIPQESFTIREGNSREDCTDGGRVLQKGH